MSVIFVKNVSDKPVYFGIGSMKLTGFEGLNDWDAAMAARSQFLPTQPTTQPVNDPPTSYTNVQPQQMVRFVVPRKAAHNRLSGDLMVGSLATRYYAGPVYELAPDTYGRIEIFEFGGRFAKMVAPREHVENDPLSH